MKKPFLLFLMTFSLLILNGCIASFENNTRVLVKGILVDDNGQPVSNKEVNVYTSSFYNSDISDFDREEGVYLLGSNQSGPDGVFKVFCVFEKDEDFRIQVTGGSGFSNYYYGTSSENTPLNLTYDLGTVTLNRLAELNLNINRTSPLGTQLVFRIAYNLPKCAEYFINGELDPELSSCYETTAATFNLSNNNPDLSRTFQTYIGGTVTITYSLNGGPDTIETFTIDQDTYTYDFTY